MTNIMGWKTITFDRTATHLNDRTDGHYIQGWHKIQGLDNVWSTYILNLIRFAKLKKKKKKIRSRQITHYNLEKKVNDYATLLILCGQRSRVQEHFLLSPSNTPKTITSMTVTLLEDPHIFVNEGPK